MYKVEKATELLEQAAKLGLRLECDSGLILVKCTKSGDPERQDAIIAELGKYISDVHRLVQRRAIGARAKEFVGQRIWSETGEGVLAGTSSDGELTISIINAAFLHPQTLTSNAENLLIIVDEEGADGASSPHGDKPTAEQSQKGIFGRLRRSPRKD